MKAPLAIALVCLAVAGSGCDAVIGSLWIPTRQTSFRAISDDSGANASGKIEWASCCTTYFEVDVTCLRVVGNRATIGTTWPPTGYPGEQVGRLWYIEDLPDEEQDRIDEDGAPSPPTTCPDPPTTITDNEAVGGNVHVIDNFH